MIGIIPNAFPDGQGDEPDSQIIEEGKYLLNISVTLGDLAAESVSNEIRIANRKR